MKTTRPLRQKLPVLLVAGLGGLVTLVDANAAQPWAASDAPHAYWASLASSADGAILLAGVGANPYGRQLPLYLSSNGGGTWVQSSSPTNAWPSVVCSADGARMAAVAVPYLDYWRGDELANDYGRLVDNSGVFVSPDSGATWIRTSAPTNYWTALASSADGRTLLATSASNVMYDPGSEEGVRSVGDGLIYRSLDFGATWTRTLAPVRPWLSIAASADAMHLAAIGVNGSNPSDLEGGTSIYRSSDAGLTWTSTKAPRGAWMSVATSADGSLLVAAARHYWDDKTQAKIRDGVCVSLDSGLTWNLTQTPRTEPNWCCNPGIIRCSADGKQWFAGADQVYTSLNLGAEWEALGGSSRPDALAVSADGGRIVQSGVDGIRSLPYRGTWQVSDLPLRDVAGSTRSSDGARYVIFGSSGDILSSTNWGATWTRTPGPTNDLRALTVSGDGARCVAITSTGAIFRTIDTGSTWVRSATSSQGWTSVGSSADGVHLVATVGADVQADAEGWKLQRGGAIYGSSDGGTTWTQSDAPGDDWQTVAGSADGTRWVAASYRSWHSDGRALKLGQRGAIYRSAVSGEGWVPTSAPALHWTDVASSADGTVLLAAASATWETTHFVGGGIYRSLDAGATWAPTTLPTLIWGAGLVTTPDGRQWVVSIEGLVHISTDFGATWKNAYAPAGVGGFACSPDGSLILGLSYDGTFASLRGPAHEPPRPPSPGLAVGLPGSELDLSWLIPSTPFVLQQTAAIGSGPWEDVPTPPTLDLTNLHRRVTLKPSGNSGYFRLRQQ